ncbi:hypothetical protein GGP41_001285 [Bipolaris sorokiniana]|uniref:YjgF-like protein n=1 Tax=Cochliobolus sativus TaxID=45130 RepID=A0A8H6DR08_COCSA|nr:hypothetical protein GGP41_001285 [Bipolaris sorokiniana]
MASKKPNAFNPPSVPKPPPTYSQVCVTPIVVSSALVTLAGQTGLQKDDTVPSGIKAQAKAGYEIIHKCLEAADAKDVVERGWGEEWIEFMDQKADGHRPPDTVVGVASLPLGKLLYECEVTAMICR